MSKRNLRPSRRPAMVPMILGLLCILFMTCSSSTSFVLLPPSTTRTRPITSSWSNQVTTTTACTCTPKSRATGAVMMFKKTDGHHSCDAWHQPTRSTTTQIFRHKELASTSSTIPSKLGSSPPQPSSRKDGNTDPPSTKLVTALWIHALSVLMMVNYFWGAFPSPLFGLISLPAWSFIHAISAMVFSGSIVTTTVLEWNIDAEFATKRLFPIERHMVLPALSLNILSGVAMVYETYLPATLRYAPLHVKSALHVLLLFGLWWGTTDRKSQAPLEELVASGEASDEDIDAAWKRRRLSNIGSCGFILALYAIMIFKPGY